MVYFETWPHISSYYKYWTRCEYLHRCNTRIFIPSISLNTSMRFFFTARISASVSTSMWAQRTYQIILKCKNSQAIRNKRKNLDANGQHKDDRPKFELLFFVLRSKSVRLKVLIRWKSSSIRTPTVWDYLQCGCRFKW